MIGTPSTFPIESALIGETTEFTDNSGIKWKGVVVDIRQANAYVKSVAVVGQPETIKMLVTGR